YPACAADIPARAAVAAGARAAAPGRPGGRRLHRARLVARRAAAQAGIAHRDAVAPGGLARLARGAPWPGGVRQPGVRVGGWLAAMAPGTRRQLAVSGAAPRWRAWPERRRRAAGYSARRCRAGGSARRPRLRASCPVRCGRVLRWRPRRWRGRAPRRSEEHTSELQSRENLVCRLLLEKKNKQ